jgi:hypothetical protein
VVVRLSNVEVAQVTPRKCAWPQCGEAGAHAGAARSMLRYCAAHSAQVLCLRGAIADPPPDAVLNETHAPWVEAYRKFWDNDYNRHEAFDMALWEVELQRARKRASARSTALLPKCGRCSRVSALDPCRACVRPDEAKRLRYPSAAVA